MSFTPYNLCFVNILKCILYYLFEILFYHAVYKRNRNSNITTHVLATCGCQKSLKSERCKEMPSENLICLRVETTDFTTGLPLCTPLGTMVYKLVKK